MVMVVVGSMVVAVSGGVDTVPDICLLLARLGRLVNDHWLLWYVVPPETITHPTTIINQFSFKKDMISPIFLFLSSSEVSLNSVEDVNQHSISPSSGLCFKL